MKIHRLSKCCLALAFLFWIFPAPAGAALWDDEEVPQAPATDAATPPPLEILTVTGSLADVEAFESEGAFPWKISLKLSEGVYDLWIADTCIFFNARQREISASDFFRTFTGRAVTVDFYELKGGGAYRYAVIECRPGGR
jgi:hypothetical protein